MWHHRFHAIGALMGIVALTIPRKIAEMTFWSRELNVWDPVSDRGLIFARGSMLPWAGVRKFSYHLASKKLLGMVLNNRHAVYRSATGNEVVRGVLISIVVH